MMGYAWPWSFQLFIRKIRIGVVTSVVIVAHQRKKKRQKRNKHAKRRLPGTFRFVFKKKLLHILQFPQFISCNYGLFASFFQNYPVKENDGWMPFTASLNEHLIWAPMGLFSGIIIKTLEYNILGKEIYHKVFS